MSQAKPKKRHKGSLLNLHLVDQMFRDKNVKLVRRGVDARWTYSGQIQTSQGGFNPTGGTIFYRAKSHVESWLPARELDTRRHNYDDDLMGEVLFMVHDYMHVWAYGWINHLCPEIGLGTGKITAQNIEALTFCHLLTEAVATVGVDYWYLCTFDLNEKLDIGTKYDSVTVSYEQQLEPEYQRFCRGFTAQTPAFLGRLCKFYCTGEFRGFSKQDLARSPVLLRWLSHELGYGVNQREYARAWMSYLSRDDLKIAVPKLRARVSCNAPWQKRLIGQITELLWAKVKQGSLEPSPIALSARDGWTISLHKPVDFRFVNWNRLQRRKDLKKLNLNLDDPDNFCFWFRQFVSQYDFAAIDSELLEIKLDLFGKRRRDLLEYFFRGKRKLRVDPREPEMLFILN